MCLLSQSLEASRRDPVADQRRQVTRLSHDDRLAQRLKTDLDPFAVPGKDGGEWFTRLDPVTRLGRNHEPYRGIDVLLDGPASAAELKNRPADPARFDLSHHPLARCPEHLNLRGLRQ